MQNFKTMKKLFSFFSLLFSFYFLNAQLVFDFESGTLTNWTQSTPNHWAASSDYPIDGLYSLHQIYNSDVASHDQISYPQNIDVTKGNTIWMFKIKYAYRPSSSNNWAVILMSDKAAPAMTPDSLFNGYAIGVDLFTGSDDTLYLYKIENGIPTPILNTKINWQNDIGYQTCAIIVERTISGKWYVFVSKTGQYQNSVLTGACLDTTFTNANYFGVYYEYTSAQDQKLWLDDIKIYYPNNAQNSAVHLYALTDSIPSDITAAPGTSIASIVIKDDPSDSLPLNIDRLVLRVFANNTNANKFIAGAQLNINGNTYDGTINSNTIVFPLNISVANSDSISAKLNIFFTNIPNLIPDNSKIKLQLFSSDIATESSGSGFYETSDSASFIYSVKASKIEFYNTPLTCIVNNPFSLTVLATDKIGNIDHDINNINVTLALASGNGNLSSSTGLTAPFKNGSISWNNLTYNILGKFSVFAYTSNLGSALSPTILSNTYNFYLNDNFEDGNISDWLQSAPGHWTASSDYPIDGNFSLREVYDNSVAYTDWISHKLNQVNLNDTTKQWKFLVRYDYSSPSSSNNWNVVIMADTNPSAISNFNGYAVGINYGTTSDLLSIFKITNGTPLAILQSNFNWQDSVKAGKPIGIVVFRYTNGLWKLYIDTSSLNFTNLEYLGSVTDTTFRKANYLSVRYQYTSSLDRKLTLDDMYFGDIIPDTIPPRIDTAIAITPKKVIVLFNEPILKDSLSTKNFSISFDSVTQIIFDTLTRKKLTILLSDSLQENIKYMLKAKNFYDLSLNKKANDSAYFYWENFKITGIFYPDYNKIAFYFNKNVSLSSASDTNQYIFSPQTPKINSISINKNQITLTFDDSLQLKTHYIVTFDSLTDVNGNMLTPKSYGFIFYIPKPFDVIFNEIMFDVSPSPNALPSQKYIELYNRTDLPLNLNDWTLDINGALMKLGNVFIQPKGYLLLVPPGTQKLFSKFGPCTEILNPYYLTSSGKTITLKNYLNQQIDQISYTTAYYHDANKQNGGWSIERIDPNNICNQENNWHASINPTGGTPDHTNSVLANNPDTVKPQVLSIKPVTSTFLQIKFSEIISNQSLRQINFILNNQVTPFHINIDSADNKTVDLYFLKFFNNGLNTLHIQNLQDLCGNYLKDSTFTFTYYKIHVTNVEPINDKLLKIFFSEPVNLTSINNPAHIEILDLNQPAKLLLRDNYKNNIIYAYFDQPIKQNTILHLKIDSIADLANNFMNPQTIPFAIYTAKQSDIVFNEFMLDVSPSPNSLPPVKYIEIYNTTKFPIWLTNWSIITPSSSYILPEIPIQPYGYLILTEKNAENLFKHKALGIFSSTDLTYGEYFIKNSNGQIINAANIEQYLYHDQNKAAGGWALERINPLIRCHNDSLWKASIAPQGGTPGEINSVYTTEIPQLKTYIKTLHIINNQTINLIYNSLILDSSAINPSNYILNSTRADSVTTKDFLSFNIVFNSQLKPFVKNNLSVKLTDLCNNTFNLDTNFIYTPIHITQIIPIDSLNLLLKFSEEPADSSIYQAKNFLLSDGTNPIYIAKSTSNPLDVYLTFKNKFKPMNIIHIKNIFDTKFTNFINKIDTFYYYIPKTNDLIFSEILPYPYPNSPKFIEIYNNSQYPINLQKVILANSDSGIVKNSILAANKYFLLKPKQYAAITTDTATLIQTYPDHGKIFIQSKKLPSLPSKQGIIIMKYNNITLDSLSYSYKMYPPLIQNFQGISLERINLHLPTNQISNWTSAASTVNYATPAKANSHNQNLDSIPNLGNVTIWPSVFSPDNDGYQDQLFIKITNVKPQTYCNIAILNKHGLIIKHLAQHLLLAQNNTIIWDGTDDNGQTVDFGLYIISIKLFSSDNHTQLIRKTIAVAFKK